MPGHNPTWCGRGQGYQRVEPSLEGIPVPGPKEGQWWETAGPVGGMAGHYTAP